MILLIDIINELAVVNNTSEAKGGEDEKGKKDWKLQSNRKATRLPVSLFFDYTGEFLRFLRSNQQRFVF